jgi:tripartite-type tricarboxylate transporter receptor subunit TctC
LRNRLKLLAVTSPVRDPSLPDIPTLDESGLKGYDATFWLAMAAPTGTPVAIVKRVNAVMRDAIADTDVTKALQRQGLNPAPSSPQELTARIRADYAKWKRVLDGA